MTSQSFRLLDVVVRGANPGDECLAPTLYQIFQVVHELVSHESESTCTPSCLVSANHISLGLGHGSVL